MEKERAEWRRGQEMLKVKEQEHGRLRKDD